VARFDSLSGERFAGTLSRICRPDALFFLTVKHEELRWNPATSEWFCAKCGRTSDHVTKEDAQVELEHFECNLPSVNAVPHIGKEEGVAQLVSKRSRQEYAVAYRLEQIRDEPHLSPSPAIVTLLDVNSLEESRFQMANTCHTPKAERFTLISTGSNGLHPGGLRRSRDVRSWTPEQATTAGSENAVTCQIVDSFLCV
jgi:hypothetical protein